MLPRQAVGAVGSWSTSAIHDTVAAIARQPEYAIPIRRSLLGRAITWLFQRIGDLLELFRGSRDFRIVAIMAAALILLAVVARVVVARQIDVVRRGGGLGSTGVRGEHRDYWTISRELAAAGDYAGASHALYAAVLDALVRTGAVRFHASKTAGDYARELRRGGSPALHDFRTFGRRFDRLVYGGSSVDAEDYAELTGLAQQITVARTAA